MSDDIPVGLPFSQAYLRPGNPVQDDPRFRRRLSALFGLIGIPNADPLVTALKLRAGIIVPSVYMGSDWNQFFEKNPIVDVLDSIGIIYGLLRASLPKAADHWKTGVATILSEQAMAYRLDEECAVRRLVDEEFDRTRAAAIAGLGAAKYRVAREFFDKAVDALEQTPPDAAGMVRNVFLANEEVFKLMFPAVDRLATGNARNHLKPENSVGTQSAKTASAEMANAFAKWVAACQQYRHAPGEIHQGGEDTAAPPLNLAIAMMSSGATYLRWLIAIDGGGS